MDEQAHSEHFDLERWLRLVRDRWPVILCSVLFVALAAWGLSVSSPKEYTAQATLLFENSQLGSDILGISQSSGNPDPAREAETNVQLVESPAVALRVSRDLKGSPSPSEVSRRITVSPVGQSSVVAVQAKGADPRAAALLAATYVSDFVEVRKDADRTEILTLRDSLDRQLQALTPPQRSSPAGQSLQTRADQLDALASLQTGNASVLQQASMPSSPSSPRTKLNVIAGAFVGLLIGLGLALLLERLNQRIRSSDELGEVYDLPVLAEIPDSRGLDRDGSGWRPSDRESFRMLHAQLRYFNTEREIRSVLITSAEAREGKSTVSWYLANATAMSTRMRVLVVEADLRRPTIAARRGLFPGPGLTDVLADNALLEDAIQHVPLSDGVGGSVPRRSLDVLVAGHPVPNPGELIEGQAMSDLLVELYSRYDFVVIDTAPTLLVADAFPLMSKVGGVLVVSRVGGIGRSTAAAHRDQLRALHAPLVAVVANRVRSATVSGDYGYPTGEESLPKKLTGTRA